MPNPKRRHSNARTRKRRTHDRMSLRGQSACPQCHEVKAPHRVCPSCGFYKGKPVLPIKVKTAGKK